MNFRKIIFFSFIFILIFALGVVFGGFFIKNQIKIEKDKILSDCWDNARKELIGTCKPPLSTNNNIPETNFYGRLLEIKPDLKQIIIDPAPLGDGEDNISSLYIQIDDETIIEQVIKKEDLEYQKELEEFNKNFEKDVNLKYPMQYVYKSVDFSAFIAGQSVTVFSKEDVKNKKEVTAIKMVINYE